LAEAYGHFGVRAKDEASFNAALDQGMAKIADGRCALVEAQIDMDEQVLPMVPGGKAVDEQIV
jgi:acetolactate synthase-1/2/3 large subunit